MRNIVLFAVVLMLWGRTSSAQADTGRMSAAHIDWSRYTVGMCVAAMRTTQHQSVRQWIVQQQLGHEPGTGSPMRNFIEMQDGGHLPIPADPMTPAAVATGRACAWHLAIAAVPATTLPDFLMLALLVHNDTIFQDVLSRQLTLVQISPERALTIQAAFSAAFEVQPQRLDLAQSLLKRLDAMQDAHLQRFYARLALAATSKDTAIVLAQTDTLIALSQQLTSAELGQGLIRNSVLYPYQWRLARLQPRVAIDSANAKAYRKTREQYLAMGNRLVAAGLLETQWEQRHESEFPAL